MSKLTVFVAKEIITMNASMPSATAVAVRDDRIVEVGTLDSLQPWLTITTTRSMTRFATGC